MSNQKKQSFLGKLNEVFLKLDLFSNPQLLKYNGEGAHQTYAGSIFSIIIIVFFTIIFFNFCRQTINRSTIKNIPGVRPDYGTSFNTNQSNSIFMFAVGVQGINLNEQTKFFDVYMSNKVYKNKVLFSSQDVRLQPCLPQQWEINDQFKNYYSRLNFGHRLCPPKDYNFVFKGKLTSEEHRYTKLVVRRCSSQTNKCASPSEFTDMLLKQKKFKLSVYFANPIIDANQKQYLDYVLQDTNYFEFTDMVGVSAQILFSQYEVNTDNSIYPEPHTDITTDRGLTLNQRPVISNSEIINTDQFANIQLKKSGLVQQFNRSYTRFDATFAYLGGLFGMLLLLFYGLRAFNEYAYQFQIGSKLFVYDDKEGSEFDSDKFHIFRFPFYLIYCIVTFFNQSAEKWQCFAFYRSVDKCREEVKQQTDVCFLLKRVIYLEKAIELFCGDKLGDIRLHHRWKIDEARQKRGFYNQEVNHLRVQQFIRTTEKKAAERQLLSQEKVLPDLRDATHIGFVPQGAEQGENPQRHPSTPQTSNKSHYQEQYKEVVDMDHLQDVHNEQISPPQSDRRQISPPQSDCRLGKEKRRDLIECSRRNKKSKPRSNQSLEDLIQNKENVDIPPFNSGRNSQKYIIRQEQQRKSN